MGSPYKIIVEKLTYEADELSGAQRPYKGEYKNTKTQANLESIGGLIASLKI